MVDTPKKSKRLGWGEGRIAFTVHQKEIAEKLAMGYSLTKIHKELASNLNGLSYEQFKVLARKYASSPTARKESKEMSQASPPPSPNVEMEKSIDEEKSNSRSVTTAKSYRPGPRIPDPSKLY